MVVEALVTCGAAARASIQLPKVPNLLAKRFRNLARSPLQATSDAAILAGCHEVRRILSAGEEGQSGKHHREDVATDLKRRLVRRVAWCDGPLARHAMEGCLFHLIISSNSSDSRRNPTELEGLRVWLRLVMETIADYLANGAVCETRRTPQSAGRNLRCAASLMRVCSAVLKSEKESKSSSSSLMTSRTRTLSACPSAAARGAEEATPTISTRDARWVVAAEECADMCARYLVGIVRAASGSTLGRANGQGCSTCSPSCPSAEASGREDVGKSDVVYWSLSLVSDVLKMRHQHFPRRGWAIPAEWERERCAEIAAPVAAQSATCSSTGPTGSVPGHLDVAGLAEALSELPLERGSSTVDVALRWLEATQLLMDIAEAASAGDVFCRLSRSVPPTLWALTGGTGSLFPLKGGGEQPPGVAFVEESGASNALSQAMISLVLRALRYRGKVKESVGNLLENGDKTVEVEGLRVRLVLSKANARRPWTSAIEALAATVATVGLGEEEISQPGRFAEHLVRLFCDQDDALMEMLLDNLYVFHSVQPQDEVIAGGGDHHRREERVPRSLACLYRGHLHPATLFGALLAEVLFDSGVLLDWVISPETCFLAYLTILLRLAAAEWSEFAARLAGASVDKLGDDLQQGRPSCRPIDRPSRPSTGESDQEEELVLSEQEAERLGSAMSCLSALASSARGLERKGLAPFNLAPLLRRIDQVVSLYEDCGDYSSNCGDDEHA